MKITIEIAEEDVSAIESLSNMDAGDAIAQLARVIVKLAGFGSIDPERFFAVQQTVLDNYPEMKGLFPSSKP